MSVCLYCGTREKKRAKTLRTNTKDWLCKAHVDDWEADKVKLTEELQNIEQTFFKSTCEQCRNFTFKQDCNKDGCFSKMDRIFMLKSREKIKKKYKQSIHAVVV